MLFVPDPPFSTSRRIGADTRLYGVIGHPLGHTLSPALHNAAFEAAGLDAVYLALPVAPDRLPDAMAGVRAWRIAGLNVTVPHKVAIAGLLDGLTEQARAAGAVNTAFWEGERLLGHNTDLAGYQAMVAAAGAGAHTALLLGAGGAARAVALTLLERGMALFVAARRPEQSRELVNFLIAQAVPGSPPSPIARSASTARALAIPWSEIAGALPEIDILVNCTPVGMASQGDASPLSAGAIARLPGRAVVHDLVYVPLETPLLAMARRRGLTIVDGGVMLVAQAAEAFSAWTGLEPPVALMRRVFDGAIREVS